MVAGLQRIRAAQMLEYDTGWNIKSIVLEDAPRQFNDSDPDNILAYVDRCTAFLDDPSSGSGARSWSTVAPKFGPCMPAPATATSRATAR